MELVVTAQEVAEFAPEAPAVTATQIEEARDWAEPLLETAGVTLLPGSRAERNARRAVMAYAVSLALQGSVGAAAQDSGRIVKLKDGAEEITFADRDRDTLLSLPGDWLGRAWAYLHAAGLPRRTAFAGASR